MKPCCLNIISCDEYEKIVEGYEINGPMVGGEVGKHHYCPNDADEADRLLEGSTASTTTGIIAMIVSSSVATLLLTSMWERI